MQAQVRYKLDEEWHELQVPDGQTLLEAALDQGIDFPYSCMAGSCTACLAHLKEGQVEMNNCDVLTRQEIAQGHILTCQAKALTDRLVIEIPE